MMWHKGDRGWGWGVKMGQRKNGVNGRIRSKLGRESHCKGGRRGGKNRKDNVGQEREKTEREKQK